MPKLQFRLRTLLVGPACIASFLLGWNANESRLRARQEYDEVIALERRLTFEAEMDWMHQLRADHARAPGNGGTAWKSRLRAAHSRTSIERGR